MKVEVNWIACPNCGHKKLMKVRPDTVASNLIVYCKRCKNENLININVPSANK